MTARKMGRKKKVKWARGKELAAWRKAHGLNKSQMVDLFRRGGLPGVTWGTYHRWENGAVVPRAPYEEKMFEILSAHLAAHKSAGS